ncbi:hypothetical protein OKE80_02860 [Riemerella anatipestifer]|uniref:Lipoprotein n=1 Tax=Riemerella anatipestifer TaxID=34085 RepID=A0AAP3ALP2_RIEAN|nr:hypothetical protein [Riemerella anatipestifer]AZZ58251.1 hypothetical protein AWB57_03910 [Riemerella anatipestifer]MBT0573990.1 hypothetical protein [Riemerella anatipestifer]MCO7318332.1 hypothetical protein [Riemerella anatipestifer]MCQ4154593.1 hypothetical protein [Riemerella anatipestifer]MCQ4180591.1 hypothetical protein [Riemerella anatipestifer]
MKNLILTLLVFTTLLSCATIPSKSLSAENFRINEDEGAIAGVIGILKRTYSSGSNIYYTNKDIEQLISQDKNNKQKFTLYIGTGAIDPKTIADFQKDKEDKYVYFFFVLKEKPGNYRFNEYTYFFNSGYIQELLTYPIEKNLEFNIEKGKIKYFGTIFLDSKNRKLLYTSEFEESDLQKFKEKLPHINITN